MDRKRHLYETVFGNYSLDGQLNEKMSTTRLRSKQELDGMEEGVDAIPEQLSMLEQRRRRVYEMQFNRPYPKRPRKQIQLWQQTRSCNTLIPISPTRSRKSLDREWMGPANDSSPSPLQLSPGKMPPRKLWNGAGAETTDVDMTEATSEIKTVTTTEDELMAPMSTLPRTLTPKADIGYTNFLAQVTPPPSASTDAPLEIVSSDCSPQNVSPLSTPKGSRGGVLPGAPAKGKTKALLEQPILPSQKNMAMSMCTGFDPEDAVPYFESQQSLNDFLKENEDHTLKLYIDEYQDATFDRIVESLHENKTVRTLALSRAWHPAKGNYKTPIDIHRFLEALKCLPQLHTLLLLNARPDVLDELARCLPPNLHKFQLHMAEGAISNKLLKALAKAPKLTQVHLEINESFPVGLLLKSSSLGMLRVASENFVFESHHIKSLANALTNQKKMLVLDLKPLIPLTSFRFLTTALRSNKVLQSLRLNFGSESSSDGHEAMVDELANMIQANSTLTHVYNYSHDSLPVSGSSLSLERLSDAMQRNYTLREFHFFQEEPMFWVAKEAILKRNETYDESEPFASFFEQYINCTSLKDAIFRDLCSFS